MFFLIGEYFVPFTVGPDHLPTLKVMNRSRDETQVGTGVHKKQLIVTMEHSIWQVRFCKKLVYDTED